MTRDAPDDPILAALQGRGSRIRQVRYRQNRSVLLSVSRDGTTLNCHACFRGAPQEIVAALVKVAMTHRDTAARRAALRTLREWGGTRRGLEQARRGKPRRERSVDGIETEPLRALFRRFNADRFAGLLPEIPLRLSRRMSRSLGTIRYGDGGGVATGSRPADGGAVRHANRSSRRAAASDAQLDVFEAGAGRWVEEIAISADLLRPGNRAALEDTMLHEMAHAEAWLLHGHQGHGQAWRRVASRVGCRPRAVNDVRVEGRRR